MSKSLSELLAQQLQRRQLLSSSLVLAAGSSINPVFAMGRHSSGATPGPGFRSLPHVLNQQHAITLGYQAHTVIRWGDDLSGRPPQQWPLDASQQQQAFGFNNDFIAFMPLANNAANGSEHVASGNSRRGLLCVNHEYTLPHLMFPGYRNTGDARTRLSVKETRSEMMATGLSVVDVAYRDGRWQPVQNSRFNRRFTPATRMQLTGAAAGSKRLQTRADPAGTSVLGTLGNCAGGKTPWGTVLTAEEVFVDFFSGDPQKMPADGRREVANHQLFPITELPSHWARADDRFNIEREPREPNRFGWIVEYDPYDPASVPKKRTSLGRFEHEGATVVCKPGKPVVLYSADDDENQYLYRFVSSASYDPENHNANRDLLDDGILYCARFNDDNSGEWLPLVMGSGPLTEVNGFRDQADVLIDARRAATLLGATPMDRPEDVETNPLNDCTYVALTKNKEKFSPNSANPKFNNPCGHIIEIMPPGRDGHRDHSSDRFQWGIFLVAGDPQGEGEKRGVYGGEIERSGWFANPDNIAFDARGRLWIATDGCQDFDFADGLWCAAVDGVGRAIPRHFFSCPTGAELCGPEFTPDGTTLFVAIQHPAADRGSHYNEPSTRWPDFDPAVPPRPAVMAITREDGGLIGD